MSSDDLGQTLLTMLSVNGEIFDEKMMDGFEKLFRLNLWSYHLEAKKRNSNLIIGWSANIVIGNFSTTVVSFPRKAIDKHSKMIA